MHNAYLIGSAYLRYAYLSGKLRTKKLVNPFWKMPRHALVKSIIMFLKSLILAFNFKKVYVQITQFVSLIDLLISFSSLQNSLLKHTLVCIHFN